MITPSVAVVGAGIIGASIAFDLQRRGCSVTLVDGDPPGRGASYGNMACIATTEFAPISRPSMWAQVPRWLLDPDGPVRLSPRYLPRLMPWLMRFAAASLPSKVHALEEAGSRLGTRIYEDLMPLLQAANATDLLGSHGCLSIYSDERQFAADREHLDMIARYGFETKVLDGRQLRELEPAIGPAITKAVLLPHNRIIADPYMLVLKYVEQLQRLGGRLHQAAVVDFEAGDSRISGLRLSDGSTLRADRIVLCAGARTATLSRLLGEPIPLETERGYHTQIMSPGVQMQHSIIWQARAFMISPVARGIRVGGSVEMAGLEAPPNYRRARILVQHAREVLPSLQVQDFTEWMGHRPALPDTVPVIGPSARHAGLFYATGHGHLGLTYSATTARLIGDLVLNVKPPVDFFPFRVDRF